jgi:thioredoxin-related protein
VVLTAASAKEIWIMRKIHAFIILLSIVLTFPVQAAASSKSETKINWSSYAAAQKTHNNGRKYFIYFYSEHCGYCKMLESKTFSSGAVVDYINANYTPVRVNIDKEVSLASRFHVYTIPDLRFLTPEGDNIARWPGYLESERLLILLRYISTDSYKNMEFSDFIKAQKQE